MRVIVDLTRPDFDILDEIVRVESINDENSVYIPLGAVLASEYHCVHYVCLHLLDLALYHNSDSDDLLRMGFFNNPYISPF